MKAHRATSATLMSKIDGNQLSKILQVQSRELPSLNHRRSGHACGSYRLDDSLVKRNLNTKTSNKI